jgi:hypothetical protein
MIWHFFKVRFAPTIWAKFDFVPVKCHQVLRWTKNNLQIARENSQKKKKQEKNINKKKKKRKKINKKKKK